VGGGVCTLAAARPPRPRVISASQPPQPPVRRIYTVAAAAGRTCSGLSAKLAAVRCHTLDGASAASSVARFRLRASVRSGGGAQ